MLTEYGDGGSAPSVRPGAAPDPRQSDALNHTNMAPFLTKLYQIVSEANTDHCIQWTAKGDSFVISDPDTFARDILPTYFKHNNIRSFIRQLNTYGFRKRTNISSTDEHLEFFHAKFRRDEPALLTQIKRCHQPKSQASQPRNAAESEVPLGQSRGIPIGVGAPGSGNPDLDTIRTRVTELKSRLGSLQTEIRDYNQQMEHKVSLLMHILQTSSTPGASSQLSAVLPRLQGAPGQANAPQTSIQSQSRESQQGGLQRQQLAGNSSTFVGGTNLGSHGLPPTSSTNSMSSTDLLGRRDSLLTSIGQNPSLSNVGGTSGLTNLSGVGSSLGGMGALVGSGLAGSLSSGLTGGLGSLNGFGGGLGGGFGGLNSGMGGAGGLSSLIGQSTLGPGAGLGGLGSVNGLSMSNFVGLGSLAGAQKSSLTGGDNVAGLQHLLEAAQRQQTEEGRDGQGRNPDGGHKRPRLELGGSSQVSA